MKAFSLHPTFSAHIRLVEPYLFTEISRGLQTSTDPFRTGWQHGLSDDSNANGDNFITQGNQFAPHPDFFTTEALQCSAGGVANGYQVVPFHLIPQSDNIRRLETIRQKMVDGCARLVMTSPNEAPPSALVAGAQHWIEKINKAGGYDVNLRFAQVLLKYLTDMGIDASYFLGGYNETSPNRWGSSVDVMYLNKQHRVFPDSWVISTPTVEAKHGKTKASMESFFNRYFSRWKLAANDSLEPL